jgi:hypothetical protein
MIDAQELSLIDAYHDDDRAGAVSGAACPITLAAEQKLRKFQARRTRKPPKKNVRTWEARTDFPTHSYDSWYTIYQRISHCQPAVAICDLQKIVRDFGVFLYMRVRFLGGAREAK